MIRETTAERWEEFIDWVAFVQGERAKRKQLSHMHVSELLYRGHASAEWTLQTTLERYPGASLLATDFYDSIHAAKSQIETYTGQTWDIPTPPVYSSWLDTQSALGLFDMPAYEYLVYLRHHGFPSPLLDWTASPYIAAYFAFANPGASNDRVAIYAFIEYAGNARGGSSSEPNVHVRGPYVRSHRRHFFQQSQYTVCTQRGERGWAYASHEAAFANDTDEQDLLWKITLPISERLKALRYLDTFNLNAFSLFGSEESLMETMALRILNDRRG